MFEGAAESYRGSAAAVSSDGDYDDGYAHWNDGGEYRGGRTRGRGRGIVVTTRSPTRCWPPTPCASWGRRYGTSPDGATRAATALEESLEIYARLKWGGTDVRGRGGYDDDYDYRRDADGTGPDGHGALARDPTIAETIQTLADAYLRSGRYDEAADRYEESMDLYEEM